MNIKRCIKLPMLLVALLMFFFAAAYVKGTELAPEHDGICFDQKYQEFRIFLEHAIDRAILTTQERILFDNVLLAIEDRSQDQSEQLHRFERALESITRCHVLTLNVRYSCSFGLKHPLSYRDVQVVSVYCLDSIWNDLPPYMKTMSRDHGDDYDYVKGVKAGIEATYGKQQSIYPWVKGMQHGKGELAFVKDIDFSVVRSRLLFDNYLEVFSLLKRFDKGRTTRSALQALRKSLNTFWINIDNPEERIACKRVYEFVIARLHELEDESIDGSMPDAQAAKDVHGVIRQAHIYMLHHVIVHSGCFDELLMHDHTNMPVASMYKQAVEHYTTVLGFSDTVDFEKKKRETLFAVTMALVRVNQVLHEHQPNRFVQLWRKSSPKLSILEGMSEVLELIQCDLGNDDPFLFEKIMKLVKDHLLHEKSAAKNMHGMLNLMGKSPWIRNALAWVMG